VGKNFVLHRKKDARRIDQVNNWERGFERDPLRADQFLGGGGEKRAGLHGRIVRDDHARHAADIADSSDRARGRDFSPLLVHFVSGPKSNFEKRRILIEQLTDPFPRQQSPHLVLAFLSGLAAAFTKRRLFASDRGATLAQTFRRRRNWRSARHGRGRLTPPGGWNQAAGRS